MTMVPDNSTFVMHGARSAIADGMLHIEEQVKALEQALEQNTGLVFDLAKVLVESTCKTILSERGEVSDKETDLLGLFKVVSRKVPFLPVTSITDPDAKNAQKSLKQTLNGLNTALQGVCEMRNAFGFASHGSDSPRPVMERIQALLVAQAADAIIGFLYFIHRQSLSRPAVSKMEYDDNPDFNGWLDGQCESINILHLSYPPSEVLFGIDPTAYRDLLTNYNTEKEVEEQQDNSAQDEDEVG